MKLLCTRRSPFARKVRVAAIEKGINLELIDEDLSNKSQRLKESNPIAKVPTLVLDHGQTLYDSKVIIQYLEEKFPNPSLIPSGEARYESLKMEAMADDLVVNAINAYMEKIRHPNDFNASFITAQEHTIRDVLNYLERNLDMLTPFHIGTINVACAIGYIHFRLPHISTPPGLSAWFKSMGQRPSFSTTIPVA